MACIICGRPLTNDNTGPCIKHGLPCDEKRLERIEKGRKREFFHKVDSGKSYSDRLRDAELLLGKDENY